MDQPSMTPENKPTRNVAYVRFTEEQYLRLAKDELVTGKSIPTLLKDRYFKGEAITPVMSASDTAALLKQLSYYNRNLNQITRHLHSGIGKPVLDEFYALLKIVRGLMQRIGLLYGNGKNFL